MSVRILIDCPPSRSNLHSGWQVQHRIDTATHAEMWAELVEAQTLPTPHERLLLASNPVKRTVRFTRYWGGKSKEMDKGNFISSCKHALDSLQLVMARRKLHGQIVEKQGFGLIVTDRPCHVADSYEQVKTSDSKMQGRLLVEVS